MDKTIDPNESSLIVRLPNWVGDVIMALPALQAMKQMGIALQLVGKPWARDLLASTDMDFVALSPNFLENIAAIKHQSHQKTSLLLTNSLSSAMLFYLAGKNSVGYKTDHRQLLLTTSLTKKIHQHEVQQFWDIARFACQYWFPQLQWPQEIPSPIMLPVNALSLARAKARLKKANIKEPFWVLCPFAHGTGAKGQPKIWPYWHELSSHLKTRPLVVCPGRNEEHLCEKLVPEATILSGLDLNEYAAILAQAEKIIANDSGPMHLGASVNQNTLGIFGVSDPRRTRPWGGDYIGANDRWPSLAEVLSRILNSAEQI